VARDDFATAPSRLVHDPVRGIALVCLAMTLFSGLDTTAKYLVSVTGLPTVQVVWVRFLGQFAAIILGFGVLAIPRLLRTQRPGLLLVRSALLLASTVCNFFAMRDLRLDQVVTVSFLTPLAVALLSGPLLGEWVGWRRLLAIMVGFCGILVAVRPGYMTFEPAFLFAFGTVVAYALFQLATRVLAATDAPEVILFYSMFAGVALMAPFALATWVWPSDFKTWGLLASMGLWAAIGHGIFIVAYRYADTNTLAPFAYISLITHTIGGYLVFDQAPDVWTLTGAAIIIASGLYVLFREQVRAREAAPKPIPRSVG
jgi:drug/metabolite transporter (DMT)-like permease